MKKHNVTILLITCCAQIVTAQELDHVKEKKPKRFSMGVQTMIMNSPTAAYSKDIHELGVGVYARYFVGKHLALSLQANGTWALRTDFYDNNGSVRLKRNGFDVPLQLEYHFSRGSKVSSFIGAGAGVSSYHTTVKPDYNASVSKTYTQSPFLQLSYGMGFDIGKRKTLTTSLFYRYNLDMKQSTIGLSFGLGRKR